MKGGIVCTASSCFLLDSCEAANADCSESLVLVPDDRDHLQIASDRGEGAEACTRGVLWRCLQLSISNGSH